ncbi:UPF0182 family protein [Microlunatus aurantiacus]|uniref:UPF0182 protein GCM10022204_37010 n=1 Tax=Microlunatus aurantiacus TaxID=446786 RepID=A0ABP7E850_9ACTN
MSTTRISGRRSAILPTLIIAAVLVVAFAIFTSFWTDRLWYQSMDFGTVFTTMLVTRIGLFAAFGLLMAVLVGGNAVLAYRLRSQTRLGPPTSPLLERYRELLDARLVWVVLAVAVLVGLFAGGAAAGQVDTFLAWRNGTPFGVTDPKFGLDIGFFIFDYPWWRFVASFVFTALIFATLVAAVVHYITGGLRFSGPGRGGSGTAQAHLSVLVGLAVLVKGISYWFDQYGLEIANTTLGGDAFTGINYTADNATVNAKLILSVIAGITALLFFANAILRRWVIPTIGLTLLILSSIVLGIVYPGAVQYFSVRPDEPDKERAYIANNIAATRAAYDVDTVEITDYSAKTQASAGQLRSDAEALPGIRLMDPAVVSPAYEQLQQVRGYYKFAPTLDVDRYTIDGAETDAVVAVREMDVTGIEGQNWNNLRTVYTHGYGLVAAYGNKRQSGGEPEWIVRDIPPQGKIDEHEPRIYFGEMQTDYSIVGAPEGSPPIELDTPGGGDSGNPTTYTYEGKGGVSVGSLWHRLLYAAKFADVNILLSDRVNSDSKIIYDRTPRERVQKAAPWLKVDGDPYPAVVDGRIVWIVDGYTTSNSYPYAQRVGLNAVTSDSQTTAQGTNVVAQPDTNINYIRNSVKAIVDAYDGSVKLYEWDETDPVLQTWKKAFPDTVLPKSEISADLREHLRYPQDLFKVQRSILARYHMTDPYNWYLQSGLWEVPNDPVGGANSTAKETPYYLSVKWPGDADPIFSLTSVYVPRGRSNLAAYMAVDADAASPNYGKLRVLRMSDTTQIDGPGQTANAMVTNETVAERLRPFQQGTAQATYGNLLTLPVGGGLLYVQPVYTQRQGSSGSYPALRFVLARFGQQVGIGDTLQEALDQVFAGNSGATTGETDPTAAPSPNPSGSPSPSTSSSPDNPAAARALDEAKTAFEAAQKALTAGDLGTYQTEIEKAEAATERAAKAMGR